MTPEIHDQYNFLKTITEMLAPTLELWEMKRANFEREAPKFAYGTMAAILPHFMSITDMRTSEENLQKAIKVSRLLGQLRRELVIKK